MKYQINLWRIIALFFLGGLFGFAGGAYITTKVILKNTPAGVTISIGKMKVKGENNDLKPDIKPDIKQETTKRKLFKKQKNEN